MHHALTIQQLNSIWMHTEDVSTDGLCGEGNWLLNGKLKFIGELLMNVGWTLMMNAIVISTLLLCWHYLIIIIIKLVCYYYVISIIIIIITVNSVGNKCQNNVAK